MPDGSSSFAQDPLVGAGTAPAHKARSKAHRGLRPDIFGFGRWETCTDPRLAPRCTATAKHTGQQCRMFAVRGSNVCYFHGGAKMLKARRKLKDHTVQNRATKKHREHALSVLDRGEAQVTSEVHRIVARYQAGLTDQADLPRLTVAVARYVAGEYDARSLREVLANLGVRPRK